MVKDGFLSSTSWVLVLKDDRFFLEHEKLGGKNSAQKRRQPRDWERSQVWIQGEWESDSGIQLFKKVGGTRRGQKSNFKPWTHNNNKEN